MKTKLLILLFACLCAAISSYAQGTLQITFDGPPLQPPGSSYAVTNYYESGMSFTSINPNDWNHPFARNGGGISGTPDDGTAYLQGSTLMFSFANGSTFGLASVDLAEYSTVFANEPVTVDFTGYHPDGSTVTTSFTTDGIIDGTGPLVDFQTFNFTGFTDLTRVEIPTYLSSLPWSLDNLVVSIPEPGVFSLFGLGVSALIARANFNRRRNR
jgi:hypothetical protein